MESRDLELINEKLIGIITLLSFIDSKLGILIENNTKSVNCDCVAPRNYYNSITNSIDD